MIDFPMAPTDWRGGRVGKIADHGHHAFFRSRSRQTPRQTPKPAGENSGGNRQSWPSRFDWTAMPPKPATTRHQLGKNSCEAANHGHVALFDRDVAKSSDTPPRTGENSGRNRQSWPFGFVWTEIVPRSAITQRPAWENSSGSRQSWPSCFSWTAIVPKPATTRDRFGKKSSETRQSWRFRFLEPPLCHNSQPAGKNSRGNRQSWPFPRTADW